MDVAAATERRPATRQPGATLGAMIGRIAFELGVAVAVLWDLTIGFVPGQRVSVLSPSLWPVAIAILLVLVAVRIVLAVAVYVRGRWTMALAWVNVVHAVLLVGLFVYVAGSGINEAFLQVVAGADADRVRPVVTAVVFGGACAIVIWDAIDSFVKALRARAA